MLTDHNSFTVALHERAFNTLIRAFRRQAPMIFNYATPDLIAAIQEDVDNDPRRVGTLACDKEPLEHNNARRPPLPISNLFTTAQYLPIPGYRGPQGISYIVQVGAIEVDFEPVTLRLPPELEGQLREQFLGLRFKVCMAIGCPVKEKLDEVLDEIPPPPPFDPNKPPKFKTPEPGDEPPKEGFPVKKIDCFCLDVYAIGQIKRRVKEESDGNKISYLSVELHNIEIVDIRPDGLENSLECLLYMVLNFGVLPMLRILVTDIVLALGPFAVSLETVSNDIPFNPAVEKDELRVFLRIDPV